MVSTSRECWATEKICGADGLAVPARHPGEAVGDVLDLDVERGGIEQVEPAARQHALPGARRRRKRGRGSSCGWPSRRMCHNGATRGNRCSGRNAPAERARDRPFDGRGPRDSAGSRSTKVGALGGGRERQRAAVVLGKFARDREPIAVRLRWLCRACGKQAWSALGPAVPGRRPRCGSRLRALRRRR